MHLFRFFALHIFIAIVFEVCAHIHVSGSIPLLYVHMSAYTKVCTYIWVNDLRKCSAHFLLKQIELTRGKC